MVSGLAHLRFHPSILYIRFISDAGVDCDSCCRLYQASINCARKAPGMEHREIDVDSTCHEFL